MAVTLSRWLASLSLSLSRERRLGSASRGLRVCVGCVL